MTKMRSILLASRPLLFFGYCLIGLQVQYEGNDKRE